LKNSNAHFVFTALVLTENVGPVLTIGINRPEVRNCVNNDTAKQLIHAFEEAEKDDAVKSIVLHGFGGSLCSGYDLSQLKDMDGEADIPQDYGPMVCILPFYPMRAPL